MKTLIDVSEEKEEYVKNLISYVNEIKPFHAKLHSVTENLIAADLNNVSVSDTLSIED